MQEYVYPHSFSKVPRRTRQDADIQCEWVEPNANDSQTDQRSLDQEQTKRREGHIGAEHQESQRDYFEEVQRLGWTKVRRHERFGKDDGVMEFGYMIPRGTLYEWRTQ
jgi:hypothetical protein